MTAGARVTRIRSRDRSGGPPKAAWRAHGAQPPSFRAATDATLHGRRDADAHVGGWVAKAFEAARADGVGALVWFEFDKETDWRLSGNEAVATAARSALEDGAWRRGGDLAAIGHAVVSPSTAWSRARSRPPSR